MTAAWLTARTPSVTEQMISAHSGGSRVYIGGQWGGHNCSWGGHGPILPQRTTPSKCIMLYHKLHWGPQGGGGRIFTGGRPLPHLWTAPECSAVYESLYVSLTDGPTLSFVGRWNIRWPAAEKQFPVEIWLISYSPTAGVIFGRKRSTCPGVERTAEP